MIHRHDEFGMYVSWRPKGTYKDMPPGFYLTAGWSNEGEADYPLDNVRLTVNQFRAFMNLMDEVGGGDGAFDRAAEHMLNAADAVVKARRAALLSQIAKAEAALDAMDAR